MVWTDTKSTGSTLTAVEYNNLANYVRPTATATVAKSEPADYVTSNYGSDDACIQAAIDYVSGIGGGRVFTREGDYTFAGNVTPKTNVDLFGVGSKTIFKTPSGMSGGTGFLYTNVAITDIRLSGFVIDGTGAVDGINGIRLNAGGTNITIDNIEVHDTTGYGIYIDTPINCIIDKCYCYDNDGTTEGRGIYLVGGATAKYNRISNCYCNNNKRYGIVADTIHNSIITNCVTNNNSGDRGLFVDEGSNIVISSCVSNDNNFAGITCADISNCVISGCSATGNTYDGILIQADGINSESISVVGCNLFENDRNGIIIQVTSTYTLDDIIVNGCNIDGNGVAGINVNDTSSVLIRRVGIYNNSIINHSDGGDRGLRLYYTDYVTIQNNIFNNNDTTIVKTNNTNTRIENNVGYNPIGAVGPPSVPATTVNYTNNYGYPCQVQVYGGTVTEIDVDDIATGLTSGIFMIPPGGTINITYSAAPSWRWWGL